MFIIGLVILLFLALAYAGLPLRAKFVVLAINSIFPDPIPILDEVLMIANIIDDILKIQKGMVISEWICVHKRLIFCVIIGIILLIAALCCLRQLSN